MRGLLHHEELNFQSTYNQTTQLGWRWRHHMLMVVVVQGKVPRVVPLGEWRKRYKVLVLSLVK
jgi:hypothetical protein